MLTVSVRDKQRVSVIGHDGEMRDGHLPVGQKSQLINHGLSCGSAVEWTSTETAVQVFLQRAEYLPLVGGELA